MRTGIRVPGWRTQVGDEFEYPKGVIGIVVAQKFPDPELIRVKLEEGIERVAPGTVWVMREAERKGHAVNFAWQTFKSHGIVPFLAPLVPYWREPVDRRADWRDIEMRATCERIIVFHDKSSNVSGEWIAYKDNNLSIAKLYVVERGKVKTKRRKQGKAPD